MEHYGKESFNFSDNFLRMTFMAKETAVEEGGQKGGAIDAIDTLTNRQKEVVKLIAANPSMTYNEIADALSINESAVGKHITAIKNKGVLIRQGGTQGYWEIKLPKT
nr:transcriptional regulator [uncultured bacterium]